METTRLHHSFYGIEFQTIFSIQPTSDGYRLSCIIEEACDLNGRTIVEAVSAYHGEDTVESTFYVAEQSETDEFSKNIPFSKCDSALALLKMNTLASQIIALFFKIPHEAVFTEGQHCTPESFKRFIHCFIEEEL